MTITDGMLEDYESGTNVFSKKFIPTIFTEDGPKIEMISSEEKLPEHEKLVEFWWAFAINGIVLGYS